MVNDSLRGFVKSFGDQTDTDILKIGSKLQAFLPSVPRSLYVPYKSYRLAGDTVYTQWFHK